MTFDDLLDCLIAFLLACLLACLLASLLACLLARLLASLLVCLLPCLLACLLAFLLACLLPCWLACLLAFLRETEKQIYTLIIDSRSPTQVAHTGTSNRALEQGGVDLSGRHGKSLRHCRVLRHCICDVAGAGSGVVGRASPCVAGRPLVGSLHTPGFLHAE